MQWEKFLSDNSIEYVTSGPNTKRGEISVRCPWCRDEDPSQHMGINLTKEAWGCHRNAEHRGKAPHRLISALLGCSFHQAIPILRQYNQSDPDELDQVFDMLKEKETEVEPEPGPVEWPEEFREIAPIDRFGLYLCKRGFEGIGSLVKTFNLKCANTGPYKDRVIFPLYNTLDELLGWTGRAIINPKKAPRYLSSSKAIKTTVYGYETAKKGGNALFITEGPFDALKGNYVAKRNNIDSHSVAVMGTTITIPQMIILRALIAKHQKAFVHFDPDAMGSTLQIATTLNCRYVMGWYDSDPAAMAEEHLKELLKAATQAYA